MRIHIEQRAPLTSSRRREQNHTLLAIQLKQHIVHDIIVRPQLHALRRHSEDGRKLLAFLDKLRGISQLLRQFREVLPEMGAVLRAMNKQGGHH